MNINQHEIDTDLICHGDVVECTGRLRVFRVNHHSNDQHMVIVGNINDNGVAEELLIPKTDITEHWKWGKKQ